MADGGYVEESGGHNTEQVTPEQEADKAIVDEVNDNLTFAMSYEDVQRKAETFELEFEDDMWGQEARDARADQTDEATSRKVPAKPTVSANLLGLH